MAFGEFTFGEMTVDYGVLTVNEFAFGELTFGEFTLERTSVCKATPYAASPLSDRACLSVVVVCLLSAVCM